jgi:predicted PurR-regulated permease PerM
VWSGLAILAFLILWFQLHLLLLAFAGILVAVILRAMTRWVDQHSQLSGAVAYAATLFLIGAIATVICVLLLPGTVTQFSQVVRTMPQSFARLEAPLQRTAAGQKVLAEIQQLVQGTRISQRLPQIAGLVTKAITDIIVIVVIGFFAALSPRGYREGVLVLFPEAWRPRARKIAGELRHQLTWWLLGQIVPMVALGVVSGTGMWLLGVPLPWTLGLITGLAVFLPYAGTVLAGIPCVLMALQRGPQTAVYVLILFTLLHIAEGYLLTPWVQRRAVRLPPVLTILAQYFLWSVGGILGLAMAAPLAGAGIVLVKELYLHVPAQQEVVPEETPGPMAA